MAAKIQGFPDWWEFYGKKTPAYRQVGNAFDMADSSRLSAIALHGSVQFLRSDHGFCQLCTEPDQGVMSGSILSSLWFVSFA
ncbi:DNA cytosine methyltransferase [Thiothrix eikelboomii]|uniref:DNA cytosine methyltransferase n=1 Tax=Thiothrix eikelboomii TaxID=92487 RepID=UPI003BB17F42